MDPRAMIVHCQKQIALTGPDAECVFMLPGKWGKRDTRRLCPGGPTGEIVCDNFGQGMAVMFRAAEVVAFLKKELEEAPDA